MELKYVGAEPIVSKNEVSFDKSRPDSYTFLNTVVKLLEALDSGAVADEKTIYIEPKTIKDYSDSQLLEHLQKLCGNIDEIFAVREEKTDDMIEKYINRVKENDTLTPDERTAWLGNINIMRDYYMQYITNENVYHYALDTLADKLHSSHIDQIIFPLGKNIGLVMSHLIPLLTEHRPPYDATMSVEERDGEVVAVFDMNRSKPLS